MSVGWGAAVEMFVLTLELADRPTQVFYERLNQVRRDGQFDGWLETLCADFYAAGGRPSIAPGGYFRMLFIGDFEAIESQRGIAWRCQDSLSLRTFLKFALNEATPDHFRLSKIGDRLPLDVYEAVFAFVLKRGDEHGLLKGKTVGVDSTLRKTDGDARFMKMKDGSTHLAPHSLRKTAAENAIDRETSAILAAEITPTNRADSATVSDTFNVTIATLIDIIGEDRMQEAVADKGDCKLETLSDCADRDLATSFSEPKVNGQRR